MTLLTAHLISASRQKMIEPALPNDILREIGAYWNGHRLHYTCVALYASWNPDRYIVTECKTIEDIAWSHTPIRTTTTRMPNGAYHGECKNSWSYSKSPDGIETIEYYCGDIVLATHNTGYYYRVSKLINGWHCYWEYGGTIPVDMSDVVGHINVIGGDQWTCAYEKYVSPHNFISTANALVAQTPGHGGYTALPILSRWYEPMPGTNR